jgi:deoxyribodipyrimidine photo-lyase
MVFFSSCCTTLCARAGLEETEASLRAKRIPFHLLRGEEPSQTVPAFAAQHSALAVVTDMSPLRVPVQWTSSVAAALQAAETPLFQVDAHNVVPVWTASDKQENGARTIRSKIHKLLCFLTNLPALEPNAEVLHLDFN